ncbi:MaoC family dehydratase N-terminal domain-containing protein [Chloroflexota bacterium]
MVEDSVITDEMRSMIGVESESSVFEIEKEPIRRWAEAIGDTNSLYRDEEYARKKGYGSIIAPPGFVAQYAYPVKAGQARIGFRNPFTRRLNGGNEYEFFKTVQAGDVLTATTKLVGIYQREGRMGKMLFVINETTFKNQDGEVAAKTRHTRIYY